ncbi:MAG TPA: GDSL-type esterase/lipase family protein, partial [Armatimonadota bacterium]|nr:GDSL-type esterase/lipase family protein [Armatimonadota bacterium]
APLKLADGGGALTMQPRSIYAVTALPPGDLDLPQRIAGSGPSADALYQTALISEGDHARLQHVLAKARRGEDIIIGVIGGSITGGAGASSRERSYGSLVADWWRTTFPEARIEFVNAGIGGTGSIYGALRAQRDLLSRQPDFVITEFAVNDGADQACADSIEGLTRQILTQPNSPANLMLFMVHHHEEQARNVQAAQIPVGEHYGLPAISFRDAVWTEIEAGRLTWESILADTVHPNDAGHRLAADLVIHHLEKVLANLPAAPDLATVAAAPDPLHTDAFEQVVLHEAGKAALRRADGWEVEDGDWRGKWWAASQPGSVLELEIDGDVLTVYTNRTDACTGVAEVTVDDGESAKIHGWFGGDILSSGLLFRGLGAGRHTVRVTLLEETWPEGDDHTVRVYAFGAAAVRP